MSLPYQFKFDVRKKGTTGPFLESEVITRHGSTALEAYYCALQYVESIYETKGQIVYKLPLDSEYKTFLLDLIS